MTEQFTETVDAIIDERSLLKHPFYQAWTAGTLPLDTLREYAKQYFHFEAAFPTFLSAMHARCEPGATRQALLENLWDEEHGADNHLALWLRFCDGLGLDADDVGLDSVRGGDGGEIDTVWGPVELLEAVVVQRAGLREEREDPAAVVIDHHDIELQRAVDQADQGRRVV